MNSTHSIELSGFLPDDTNLRRLRLLRLFLGITFVLGVLAVSDQRQFADEVAVWAVSPGWRWAIRIGWMLVSSIGLMFISTWTEARKIWLRVIAFSFAVTARLGFLRILLIIGLSLSFPLVLLGPYGRFVLPFFPRLLIFWGLTAVGAWTAHSLHPSARPLHVFATVALGFGVIYRASVFSADISTYPFSLGWSEASRYYYASLFLSERIYGISVPPSVLHPTRYLIQAVPFLIPGAGLLVHRLWQVVIWIGLTVLTGVVLARRLDLQARWTRWSLVLWVYLFIFQGPVWYHLLVMVIFVVWGTRTQKPLITLGVVILASFWAGISRVNWIPVPAMMAALLYLLERKKEGRGLLTYFAWPAAWFIVGSAAGFASQRLYILISGNEPGRFSSSFESPLLWYRLLPSGTYPLGVLPGIILASLPLAIMVAYLLHKQGWRIEPLRLAAIAAILAVLLVGGIIVSAKIGGGSNLHNLDAFLVALLIVGGYGAADRWQVDHLKPVEKRSIPVVLGMLAIWMPICFTIGMGRPLRSFDMQQANESLARIRSTVAPISAQGGNVLFISQRHLQTFGLIDGVELIPEYETVFLMEMAMSRNREYLDQFHEDLNDHRFDLIVVDRLSTQIQEREHNFAEENNAWVEEVSNPVLCHYGVVERLATPPVDILAPKDSDCLP
ncbi:MAG: hypothetical protein P1P76_02255 [Anaerolineales bacterium]|nr:hypothetical protein [Anaerolineales bacterium]